MGTLIYGTAPALEIDDWSLSHLQAVIVTKLRRDEAFTFSWGADAQVSASVAGAASPGPGMIWISRSTSLYFAFDAERSRPLNKRWLVALADAANGNGGLRLLPEPE